MERWNTLKSYYLKSRRRNVCVPTSTGEDGAVELGQERQCEYPVCRREGGDERILAGNLEKCFEEYYKGSMKVWLTLEIESLMSMV